MAFINKLHVFKNLLKLLAPIIFMSSSLILYTHVLMQCEMAEEMELAVQCGEECLIS